MREALQKEDKEKAAVPKNDGNGGGKNGGGNGGGVGGGNGGGAPPSGEERPGRFRW
jgi:hypothetical protein